MNSNNLTVCPFCCEELPREARRCSHCDEMLPSPLGPEKNSGLKWFYECAGERHGPFQHQEIIDLIRKNKITSNNMLWHSKSSDWMPVENTVFRSYLPDRNQPPALPKAKLNNTFAWLIALSPLVWLFLASFIEASFGDDIFNTKSGWKSLGDDFFKPKSCWWKSLLLALPLIVSARFIEEDIKVLKKAGFRASSDSLNMYYSLLFIVWLLGLFNLIPKGDFFAGIQVVLILWIFPYHLFHRSNKVGHKQLYTLTLIVTFILLLAGLQ